jgi:hypothetical protein
MDLHRRAALEAIESAKREVEAAGPYEVTPEHWRWIDLLMSRPENRDGADKSHVWRIYESVRRHFLEAQPLP